MNNGGAEDVLSATSLKTFRRCPQQWAFAHVEKIRMPPSVKMVLGNGVHYGAEHNYRQKLTTELDEPEDVVVDAFSTSYDMGLEEVEKPDEDPGKAKDQGAKLMRMYQRDVAPHVQPLWVERQTIFRVIKAHEPECDSGEVEECRCGVPFSATTDLIDEARQVRELKTTKRTPAGGEHLLQTVAAGLGYEAETGEKVTDLIVDTLIRTKVPDRVDERWGGPIDDHLRRVFATQVDAADRMITAGLFPASGADAGPGGPCSWCGYRPICPVWQKRKQ